MYDQVRESALLTDERDIRESNESLARKSLCNLAQNAYMYIELDLVKSEVREQPGSRKQCHTRGKIDPPFCCRSKAPLAE